ncbi:MAG: DUF92 domain-containing protein, partial [Bacteroidota bacterium]
EWLRLAAVFVGLGTAIGTGEAVRILFRWSPEFTRKFVHVTVGLLAFFSPAIFHTALPAILLGVAFTVINIFAVKFGLFRAMHGTARPTYGTVFYPLAFLILVLLFWYRAPLVLSLSMLVLALGDAAAAIVGESYRTPTVFRLSSDKKSVEGSIAMFMVTFVTLFAGIQQFGLEHHRSFEFAFAVATVGSLTATAWEALSSRGLDNLTIPLSTAFVLWYYLYPGPEADLQQFTMGTGLAVLVAVVSFRVGFLDLSGAVATFLLATIVFGVGGWVWTLPILAFFILSSLLSRLGRKTKAELGEVFSKGSTRDYAQVFANGGVAGILVFLSSVFPRADFFPLYLGSLAAVMADTWGTEIGLLSKTRTVLLTTFRRVAPGTNGGVTLTGFAAGAAGAAVIGVTGGYGGGDFSIVIPVVIAGVVGSGIDSLVGATLQAEFQCPECGKVTEKSVHCRGMQTRFERGWKWMNNDRVNWFCAIAGAAAMVVLEPVFRM